MIIGFAGKAASGKTTAAGQMQQVSTQETHIIPMAKLLRDEVEMFLRHAGAEKFVPLVYGCQDDKVRVFYLDTQRALAGCPQWANFAEEHSDIQDRVGQTALTVRRILQWWGTEYRRAQDPDYWTKAWADKVQEYDLERTHILVDDVRFINELNTIKQQGGLIYKIERPGFDGANNHASETSLDEYREWDGILRNDGSLAQFQDQVTALAKQLMQG